MVRTKLFKNGGNQAVRIPKRWSFDGDAVTMIRQGDSLVIRPQKDDWSELEDLAAEFDCDFMQQEAEPLEADPPVRFE
jgi:antitoxin VapB